MAGVKGRSGGSNRKPLAAHLAAGTYRRDRHGALGALALAPAAPPHGEASPAAPEGLSEASAALWERLVGDFAGWGAADLTLLGLALRHLDLEAECRQRITAEGLIVTSARGITRPHPLLNVARDAALAALALFRHLGLGAPR